MLSKILAVASIAIGANADDDHMHQYVATFSEGNVVGTVTVDNGYLEVDIDLSGNPSLPKNFSYCTEGGMSYHIHDKWTYNDNANRLGGDCGGTYTGGHYDPWNACGGASGNAYCKKATSTASTACIPTSLYSPDFPMMPFSAEVGDWSNKYAKLTLDDDMKLYAAVSSFWEVKPEEMAGKAVVFHCNNGDRAFCANFVEGSEEAERTIPSQDSTKVVAATFDVLSEDSMIKMSPDGSISVVLDANSAWDSTAAGCDEYEFSIFEAGDTVLTGSALSSNCDGKVGAQYDPTKQCLPWSGQQNCTMGKLCGDMSYEYDCDFATDRFSCAPGDISGKMDTLLDPTNRLSMSMSGGGSLSPDIESLIGKVVVINCPYDNSTSSGDIEILACAAIEEYEDDGIQRVSFVVAVILSFTALLY